jgi:hypothetical protein
MSNVFSRDVAMPISIGKLPDQNSFTLDLRATDLLMPSHGTMRKREVAGK